MDSDMILSERPLKFSTILAIPTKLRKGATLYLAMLLMAAMAFWCGLIEIATLANGKRKKEA